MSGHMSHLKLAIVAEENYYSGSGAQLSCLGKLFGSWTFSSVLFIITLLKLMHEAG